MPNPTQPKPKKAWPFLTLYCHRNGQWCKKIRGKHDCFGTDAWAAHEESIRSADDLHVGRASRHRRDYGLPSVKESVNRFLNAQRQAEANGSNGGNRFDEGVRAAMYFPKVAAAALKHLDDHDCPNFFCCCLSSYRNEQWHSLLVWPLVALFLPALSGVTVSKPALIKGVTPVSCTVGPASEEARSCLRAKRPFMESCCVAPINSVVPNRCCTLGQRYPI